MPTSIVVYTGPACCGKTWRLLRTYRETLQSRGRRAERGEPENLHNSPLALDSRRSTLDSSLWLAPAARAAAEIRRALLTDGLGACLDPGIMTFDQLAERVLAHGRPSLRPISPAGERELLRRIADDARERALLAHYGEAARRASFTELLVDHIRELKQHAVSPADYAKTTRPGRDQGAHRELAHLYTEYEARLAAGSLYDREGRHLAARLALATSPHAWPRQLELIVVDGFTDFTRAQLAILDELARRARCLLISLPGEASDRQHLFAKTATTLEALRRSFPKLRVEQLAARPTNWPALDHLATHLFRNPKQVPVFDDDGQRASPPIGVEDDPARKLAINDPHSEIRNPQSHAFEIIEAASAHDEICQIARRVKLRLLDGARPSEIVVVFRTLGDSALRVREVFNQFGIPFALESRTPLMRANVLRALLALLRLVDEDWPFRRVVAILTNNSLRALDGDARVQGEWLVRDLQIASGREALLTRVQELADEATTREDEPRPPSGASDSGETCERAPSDHFMRRIRAAVAALSTLKLVADSLDALPNVATLAEWAGALERLGVQLGLSPFVVPTPTGDSDSVSADTRATGSARADSRATGSASADSCATGSASALPSTPAEESRHLATLIDQVAWQAIVRHFNALEQLDRRLAQAPRKLARKDLLPLLVDLASHEFLPRPHDEVGRVRILAAATARAVSAGHVYLAGMSEQAFPSPERAGRLCPTSDYHFHANVAHQPESFTQADGALTPPLPTRAQDEMLLFYEVVTRATQSLTISFPALDDKAQDVPPSPYVGEVERTLGPENIRRTRAHLSPIPAGPTPLSIVDWRVQAVARALDGDRWLLANFFRCPETSAAAASIEAGLHTVHDRGRRERFSAVEGLLPSPAVRAKLAERFGPNHLWSPSQWEQYAACPFKFLLASVLKFEPLGDLTLETDHARRGSLLHRVMAAFHRRLRAELAGDRQISSVDRKQLVAQFQETLAHTISAISSSGVDAALIELDRRQIDKWAAQYFDQFEKYESAWSGFDQPPLPTHFELRFGPPRFKDSDEDPDSLDQAFVLKVGKEEIRIAGRIDRIDVGRAGEKTVFNVVDYKSGRRPALNKDKIESGERLQPALYVMAAQALFFGEDKSTPLWAGYWSMASGVNTDARYSLRCSADGKKPTEDWQDTKKVVTARIGQLVTAIRQGDFPVHSLDDQCTSHCDFSTICRIAQIRSLDKPRPTNDETPNA